MVTQEGDGLTFPIPASSLLEHGIAEEHIDPPVCRDLTRWIDDLAKRGLHMQIDEADQARGRLVLRLSGRLDRQSVPVLKDAFPDIVAGIATCIDVDLAGIERVDGLGLAAMVWAWRSTQQQGLELRLSRMRPDIRELVAKMNLHQLLRIIEAPNPAAKQG